LPQQLTTRLAREATSSEGSHPAADLQIANKVAKYRRGQMLLMEKVYQQLKQDVFVETAEDFSVDWCWRSKSWFAVQRNSDHDFTVEVAINCLNTVKKKIAWTHLRRKKLGSIADSDLRILNDVRFKLERYLLDQHRITAVADPDLLVNNKFDAPMTSGTGLPSIGADHAK
jgi:hypothetical protein